MGARREDDFQPGERLLWRSRQAGFDKSAAPSPLLRDGPERQGNMA